MAEAASVLVFLIAGLVYLQVYGGTMAYPSTVNTTATEWTRDILGSVVARPTEEILLAVVLVFALRAAGCSWTTVFITGAVLRILFHLCHGWSIVLAAVWPALVILFYQRTRTIWGIIIAHSWFDVTGSLVTQLVTPSPCLPGRTPACGAMNEVQLSRGLEVVSADVRNVSGVSPVHALKAR